MAGADFDQNYQPINSLYPTAAPGSYIVQAGDTLQSIAMALWGDSAMWYLLADANGLAPNQPLIANTVLTVPNKVTNIHNNASTFKPYDAGAAMGNTTPTVPEPPPPPAAKKGCGGFVKILAIIVAVVVTIYTAGAAAGVLGAATGGASTVFGAGLAVLGGSGGLTMAAIGAAAIGGAVGSIASQAVLIAGGVQEKFDWKGMALSAVGAGVTAGLGGSGLSSALPKGLNEVGRAAVMGGVNSAVTQGIAVATGLQDSFDWKSVAISAVGAGVAHGVSEGVGRLQYGSEKWNWLSQDGVLQQAARNSDLGKTLIRGFAGGAAAGVVSAAARGNMSGRVLTQIGLDVLGSTIGNAIADRAAAGSIPSALSGVDTDSLIQMDRLARNAGRDPAGFNPTEWNVLIRAAETSGAAGQQLSKGDIANRTMDYLSVIGRYDQSSIDSAMSLYMRGGLVDAYGQVQQVESLGRSSSTDIPAQMAAEYEPEQIGTWLNETLDQGVIGTGYVGRRISEEMDAHPWVKVAAVGLDVAAGPVKFAFNQAVQHSPLGTLLESANAAVSGYVSSKLSGVGHSSRDSNDGGAGGVVIGGLIAGGALYALKKLNSLVPSGTNASMGSPQSQRGHINFSKINNDGARPASVGSVTDGAGRSTPPAAQGPNRIYSARELMRRVEEPGPYHNFPESFNPEIFNGTRTVVKPDYILYETPGSITLPGRPIYERVPKLDHLGNETGRYTNQITGRGEPRKVDGVYEIGVRPSTSGRNETITHRFFRKNNND